MRFRFLLPVRFIGTIRRKIKKRTISSSRPESRTSLEKLQQYLNIPEIEVEPPQIEPSAHPELVVSKPCHLEPPADLQETLQSTSSRGRNASRNQGYSSFASSSSSHRLGYRLKRSPRKARKPKNSLQRKLKILASLLPMFHETLSVFNDVYQAAAGVKRRFTSAYGACRPLPVIIFVILLISSPETILTLILSTLMLALHLYSPKIFKPNCKVQALPRISVQMCLVFQKSVSFAAVGINLISFRGGSASVTVWTLGLTLTYIGQIIGHLNAVKLAILLAVIVKHVAPEHGLICLRHFKKQLKLTPGIELFQADHKRRFAQTKF